MVKTNVPYPSVPGKKQTEICIPPVIGIFESLVDWRKARGKVYPLSALLLVVLAGLMCGKQSLKAIARRCAELCFLDRARLGLPLGRSPGATTLGRLPAKLDPVALGRAMKHWLTAVRRELRCAGMARRIAIDGKTLRGAARRGANPVHLLRSATSSKSCWLRSPWITAVIPLLRSLVLEGRLVTMDALLTQREVAQEILARKGDYLMVVKENQPQLFQDIAICFDSEPLADEIRGTARTIDKGHGRLENVTGTALKGFVDWPGAEQVMKITRTVTRLKTGQTTTESVYAITGLPPSRGSPALLLEAIRGHWVIENDIHWIRDVTLGEDRCAVHKDYAPQVLAILRKCPAPSTRSPKHRCGD
ncbi:MAG: ISAs1 family transposase [Chloroflexia bacterium]